MFYVFIALMRAGEGALVEVRGQLGEVSSSYSVGSGD